VREHDATVAVVVEYAAADGVLCWLRDVLWAEDGRCGLAPAKVTRGNQEGMSLLRKSAIKRISRGGVWRARRAGAILNTMVWRGSLISRI